MLESDGRDCHVVINAQVRITNGARSPVDAGQSLENSQVHAVHKQLMLRDRELRAISGLKIRQTDTKGKCPGSVVERGEIGKVRGIRSAIGLVADGVCSRIRTIPKLVLRQSAKGIPVEQCGKAGFR